MVSSGTTAVATSGTGVTTAISSTTLAGRRSFRNLRIVNEGAAPGFYAVDGGTTWLRLSAASAATAPFIDVKRDLQKITDVQVKRDGGTDLSGIYCEVW